MFDTEKFNERCEEITKRAIEQMEDILRGYQLEIMDTIKELKEENSDGSKSN